MIKFGTTTYAPTLTPADNNADKYLDQMSGPELVTLFRLVKSNLGEEVRTTRFPDSKTAIKRTWAALEAFDKASDESLDTSDNLDPPSSPVLDQPQPPLEDRIAESKRLGFEVPEEAPAAPKEPKEPKARKPRGMRFVFPVGDEIKPVRAGTFRAKLVELFSTKPGATFDEALAATWGSKEGMDPEVAKKTCYEGIRLLHYYVGYGMKQDADGRITIHK